MPAPRPHARVGWTPAGRGDARGAGELGERDRRVARGRAARTAAGLAPVAGGRVAEENGRLAPVRLPLPLAFFAPAPYGASITRDPQRRDVEWRPRGRRGLSEPSRSWTSARR